MLKLGVYRHYKGKEVELVGCYPLEDNKEYKVCVYKCGGKTYVRSEFSLKNGQGFDQYAHVNDKRFEFVSALDSPIQLFVETLRMNRTVFYQRCADDIGYRRSGGAHMFKFIVGDKVSFAKSIRLISVTCASRILGWVNTW